MTWLPVPGWVGYYEVSDTGQVRSVSREVQYVDGHTSKMRGRTLRPSRTPKGYQIVILARDGERRAYPVHRLVAEAFLGPLPAGLQTCHDDGNKDNNAASNLRYDTPAANEADKRRHGANRNAAKTHCPQGHVYTPENTRRHSDGGRSCKSCHREQRRAARERARLTRRAAA